MPARLASGARIYKRRDMSNKASSIISKKIKLAKLRLDLEKVYVEFIEEKLDQGLSYREMASLLKEGDHTNLFYIAKKHGLAKKSATETL